MSLQRLEIQSENRHITKATWIVTLNFQVKGFEINPLVMKFVPSDHVLYLNFF